MIIHERLKKEDIQLPFSKAVADLGRGIISVNNELHIDCAEELLKDGSRAADLWGFNIYPDSQLDFISLINIRPKEGNRSMEIQSQEIRSKIESIVKKFLKP